MVCLPYFAENDNMLWSESDPLPRHSERRICPQCGGNPPGNRPSSIAPEDFLLMPKNNRRLLVHITFAGERCCAEAACQMEEAEEKLLRGFSDEERKLLNHLLTRVADNLK